MLDFASISLKIDNSNNRDIPPWNPEDFKPYPRSVDFNIYGGINSDAYLLVTDSLQIASTTVTTPSISRRSAAVRRVTEVKNHYDLPVTCVLKTELINAEGSVLEVAVDEKKVKPLEQVTFFQEGEELLRPRLWSPDHPYLYRLRSRLFLNSTQVDETEVQFGMRWFEWKPFKGLFLNGEKLFLRGVSRHQEFPAQGNALSNAQHVRDMELVKSLGANYVRLAHYPQDPAVLEACDRLGLVVWEEIPVAISVGGTPGFTENALRILREMIRRDRNHPSIAFWGLMNETTEGIPFSPGIEEQDVVDLAMKLNRLAKVEDPTRITLVSGVTPAVAEHADLDVPQFWSGWFEGTLDDYGRALDARHETDPSFMGGSYGASSQVGWHTPDPKPMDFSETYQCRLHESYLKQGEARSSWYAGACAWTAFDFGSNREDRASNPLPYVNQKGLFDAHRNPKDVYYLYKSYWTDSPSFVYIVSKTWSERTGEKGAESGIRVYSNCPEVELFLNDISQGVTSKGEGFVWQVRFREGVNELRAEGMSADDIVVSTDELRVTYRYE
jgi:beta-galactosidase